ncbi:MAG: hypothetical protein K2H46_12230, partial [Muribaculaceae bacterium]|nr:hypothetical protein [Muribaculaceae bacterium]
NIPNTTSVTFGNSTYLELTGILKAGTDASDATKALFTDSSHPDLYYYDDGTFQSTLTATTHTDSGEGGNGWHKISYDTTLGGYKVTYRHAIRHDAGEGKNNDDGTIYPMEYAVVRN